MRSKHRTNPATGCSTLRKCLRKSAGDVMNVTTRRHRSFCSQSRAVKSQVEHICNLCVWNLWVHQGLIYKMISSNLEIRTQDSKAFIKVRAREPRSVSKISINVQCLLVIRKLKSLSYNKWLFRARKPHSSFIVYRVGTFWKYPFCPNKNSFRTCSQERNPLWEARRSLSKSVKEEKKERKKTYESTVHHRVQTSKFQNKAISRICQNAYLKKIMQDLLQNGIDFRDNRRSVSIRITGTSKHCGCFEWAWYEPYSLIRKTVEACLWDAWACAASYREAGWILMCIRTFSSDSAKCSKVVWTVPLSTSR